jgi:hypothetical protein
MFFAVRAIVCAGDLHGVLDGFRAGVEQRRALGVAARGEAVECLAHLDVSRVRRDHEAGVGELGDLVLDVLDHVRVRVADGRDGDARAHVDERVAVDVDEHATAGAGDVDRQPDADAGRDGLRLAGVQGQ